MTYLLLAATSCVIPQPEEVVEHRRRWELEGAAVGLDAIVAHARALGRWRWGAPPAVRIESGVIVDVHDTASTVFTTGIQRVVRETIPHWAGLAPLHLIAWDDGFEAPRTLTEAETSLAVGADAPGFPVPAMREVVIPFGATIVLPEIAVDQRRATRLRTIALYSGSRSYAIGHDCIPVTTAETAGGGMPGGFARYLSALAAFDRVATTSRSSLAEFSGWRAMLGGAGVAGPDVAVVPLPGAPVGESESESETEGALRARLEIEPRDPIVLAVGSHEPRKNHLALLQAAELVWRAGVRFTLVLVGGNSWDTAAFDRAIASARGRGRQIVLLSGSTDATVNGLYRAAAFTVFPSVNEGFGLPVVESIAHGTPVITSNFGSMKELAEGRGGLLVDPRNDASIAAAITRLLTDGELLADLREQTGRQPARGWGDYASELWATFAPETS